MADWGSGLEGAGGGAMTGAAIGSVIPGIGTAVGGIVGGGIGLLGGLFGNNDKDQMNQRLQDYYNQVQNRGPTPQSAMSGFRQNQADLINRLDAMSKGQGPSLAAQQFQQATDRNVSGQQAMANSGRGGPMAQLTAANNMAGLGAQAAQGSAIARTNEQMGALNQLGGVINQGRNSDENTNLANMMAKFQMMGMSTQQSMQILQMLQGNNAQPSSGDRIMAGGAGMFGAAFGRGGSGAGAGAGANMGGSGGPVTSHTNSFGGDSSGMFGQYQRPYN